MADIHRKHADLFAREAALNRSLLATKRYDCGDWGRNLDAAKSHLEQAEECDWIVEKAELIKRKELEIEDPIQMKAGDNWEKYRLPLVTG